MITKRSKNTMQQNFEMPQMLMQSFYDEIQL